MKAKLPSRTPLVRPSVKPTLKPLSSAAKQFVAASAPPPAAKAPLTAKSLSGLSGRQISTLAETRRNGGDMRGQLAKMQQSRNEGHVSKSWNA